MQRHSNNIGALRLALASLVIIGHAPELIDGNRSREPMSVVWPYASLGGFAVSGFFLLSGYLITRSMLSRKSVLTYLAHRIFRIVPGYVVAFVISFFVVGPALGINTIEHTSDALVNLAFLRAVPELPGIMHVHYPSLNAALWTIAYEFRCYLFVALLWKLNLIRRPTVVVGLTIFLLGVSGLLGFWSVRHALSQPETWQPFNLVVGPLVPGIPLYAAFMVGCCYSLYRHEVDPYFSGWTVLASLGLATIAFHSARFEYLGRAILFAVPIFWLSFKARLGPFQKINDTWDISYGVYLYGWLAATAFLILHPQTSPMLLALTSLSVSLALGVASWVIIERPARDLAANRWQ